jgi:uncharacterized protein (TIRG00374 family)
MPRKSGNSQRSRVKARSLIASSVLLAIIIFTAFTLIAGDPASLARLLLETDPLQLAKVSGLILAAEALRAARLVLITRHMGKRMSFASAMAARLLGRLAGLVTPGSFASTPVRAAVIGAYSGLHIGSALGAAVLETLADSLVASIIALASAIPLLPKGIPVVLLSLFAASLWLAGTAAAASASLADRAYRRLGLPVKIKCKIEMQRRLLVDVLSQVKHARFTVALSLLTVAAYLAEAASVLEAWGSPLPGAALLLLPAALGGVSAAYVASAFPTPGGSGVVELALSVYLDPRSLISWRLAQLAVGVLPAALILVVIPNLREYFTAKASLGGDECDDKDKNL